MLPIPSPERLTLEPELAHEASYLAASARMANFSFNVLGKIKSFTDVPEKELLSAKVQYLPKR